MRDIGPVLIANRGEIAIRIARTVRALGMRAVGVITEADTGSPHTAALDASATIGSYLDAGELLGAAERLGARAVHPGYGFLAENAAFAQAVLDAGLTWIGPPPQAIELMGDKGRAKEAATAAGVPVVPSGEDGGGVGGYPLMVKAVAGGGGKGMRIVRSAEELEDATAAAQREAKAAFGDDRVLIERYLERPRHIEVQVLADTQGNVIHLGERECSLQRRHQKVVEEAPSPVVDASLRAEMGGAAVALARACGYVGAGTVEFIVPGDQMPPREFFFLEMNTRLQVEHPVTELVYGVDLVEEQLRVAAGEALRVDGRRPDGWAVEARLYAEDPAAGFLPAIGTVRVWDAPEGVRVDAGVAAGSEISTSYDPMLAKVIAHGADRGEALARLDAGLARLSVLGVATNAGFTRALLARDDVRAGLMDTGLLERVLPELGLQAPPDLPAAAALAGALADAEALAARTSVPPGPWRRRVQLGDEVVALTVRDGVVTAGDASWTGRAVREDDVHLRITLDGVERRYAAVVTTGDIWVGRDGHQLHVPTMLARGAGAAGGADSLAAPMPGTVLLVHVANGDTVAAGDVLLVMESMKMELSITAPHDGVVADLDVAPGDKVSHKQALAAVVAE